MKKILTVSAFALLAAASFASSVHMTADNSFTAYVSTSDSTLGTAFLSGDDWQTVYSASGTVPAGLPSSLYLHVVATNDGGPASFIGSFDLDPSSGYRFANGMQTLTTDTTDWTVSKAVYGSADYVSAMTSVIDYGANGVGPWGLRSGIDASARNIWADGLADSQTVYFSTKLSAAPVPEPASVAALGVGALGLLRRRRKA